MNFSPSIGGSDDDDDEEGDQWRWRRLTTITYAMYLNRLCASNSREIDHLISSVRIMRVLITKQCLVDLPRSFGAHQNDFVPVELHFDHIHTSDNIHRFHCIFSCLRFLLSILYVLFFFSFYWFGHWGREIIILLGEMEKSMATKKNIKKTMIVFNWSFSAWNHFTAVVFVGQLRNRRF